MAGNSFGNIFKISTYGESHGSAIGVIIESVPPLISLIEQDFEKDMERRRPGQSSLTTPRNEEDKVQIISGVFEGKTTGTPLHLMILNKNQESKDYSEIKNMYRPGHADFVYQEKYKIRDHRGGGRSSARETAARVAAGVVAKKILDKIGVQFTTWVHSIGEIKGEQQKFSIINMENIPSYQAIENSILRIPNAEQSRESIQYLEQIKNEGDSVGGVIQCLISNVPIGIGEPVFDKLNALLSHAMFSINAVKGLEFGEGFKSSKMKGSEYNDELVVFKKDEINFPINPNNYEGGITGGISNGNIIDFKVYFKPVSSILKSRKSVDSEMNAIDISVQGRHDPCVVPRAVPIVEAMASLTILDLIMSQNVIKIWS